MVFQLMTKIRSKKDQYFRPFSQTRDARNEIATFHPIHNIALKTLSYHWQTKLSEKELEQS